MKQLVTAVTYGSLLRWGRELTLVAGATKGSRRRAGRPRTSDEIRELILQLAREGDWGYTRILGALRRLGINKITRQTVKNILVENGIDPSPERGKGTWDEFLWSHAQTLWKCDFASKRMWTIRGCVDVYFLVFLHLGTRRCWVSTSTVNPNSVWSCQQARNFLMHAEDVMLPPKYLLRDNDAKYTKEYNAVFESSDAQVVRNLPESPKLRAHVERLIQTMKFEFLHKFSIVSERHLNVIDREFQSWYNFERAQSARDFPPPAIDSPPEPCVTIRIKDVVCETRLSGVLKSYRPYAA